MINSGISFLLSFNWENETFGKWLVVYIVSAFFLSIYKIHKNENVKFSEYMLKLFKNLLNCSIVYGILAIGLSIIVVIFSELILDGHYGDGLI